MQVRLSRDPHEALGIPGGATAPEIRHAFLTLTKQYHPAKFARMAVDVQKLANEVFLMLRAAHDNLSRPSVTPRQSGPIPTLRATTQPRAANPANGTGGTATVRPPSGPQARAPIAPAVTQPIRPVGVAPTGPRPITPSPPPASRTAPSGPNPTVGRPPAGEALRPGSARVATPAQGFPVVAPAAAPSSDREIAAVLQLIDVGQLAAAKVALESMTARSPGMPRLRALLHYVKGREAQLGKQIDVARVELQDALQIDPDLQLAKTALAELFTRRK